MDIKYAVSMTAINDIAQNGASRYLVGGHRGVSGGRVEKPRKPGDRAAQQYAPPRRSGGQVPTAAELDKEMDIYMDQRDK